MGEVVELETSEVFWDQSRVGYPRIIVQKRANRHGRFLTIEEFEGRRRIGMVLVPEGRYGQGWSCLISELRQVKASLWVGRETREGKVANTLESKVATQIPVKVLFQGIEDQLVSVTQKSQTVANSGHCELAPTKALCQAGSGQGSEDFGDALCGGVGKAEKAANDSGCCGTTLRKVPCHAGRVPGSGVFGDAFCGGDGPAGILGGTKPKGRWV